MKIMLTDIQGIIIRMSWKLRVYWNIDPRERPKFSRDYAVEKGSWKILLIGNFPMESTNRIKKISSKIEMLKLFITTCFWWKIVTEVQLILTYKLPWSKLVDAKNNFLLILKQASTLSMQHNQCYIEQGNSSNRSLLCRGPVRKVM